MNDVSTQYNGAFVRQWQYMELHRSDVSAGAKLALSSSLCKVLATFIISLYAKDTVCVWVFQCEHINMALIVCVCL